MTDRARMEVVRHRVTGLRQRGRLYLTAAADHSRRLLTITTSLLQAWFAVARDRARTWPTMAVAEGRHLLAETVATPRGRNLLVALLTLLVFGVGVVGTNLAVPGSATTPNTSAVAASPSTTASLDALMQRDHATDRADRGERAIDELMGKPSEPSQSPLPSQQADRDRGSRASESPRQADWVHPMPGTDTTSCFGPRWGVLHAGVDLAGPEGTPIQAVGAGTVTHAGWEFSGYGISVVIDHHNGYYTHYAHASEVTVSPGDQVTPGQVIAMEGSTGDSTGPHLHFEVHQGSLWNQVEPAAWLTSRGVDIRGC